jgi:hypothetical protein
VVDASADDRRIDGVDVGDVVLVFESMVCMAQMAVVLESSIWEWRVQCRHAMDERRVERGRRNDG